MNPIRRVFTIVFATMFWINGIEGQTTLLNENFQGNPSSSFPAGWSSNNTNWIRSNCNSNYTGASGEACLSYFNSSGNINTTSTALYDNSLSTIGYSTITVLWAAMAPANFNSTVVFSWGYSGVVMGSVSFTDVPRNGQWALVNGGARISLPAEASGRSSLTFQFSITPNGIGNQDYYIDDFTVVGTKISTSTSSGNWSSSGTWVNGVLPTPSGDVIIANGHTVTLTGNETRNSSVSTTINSGGTINLSSFTLTMDGDLTNNGTISNSGSGKLKMSGTQVQTISGTGSISNLEINKSSGTVTLSGANTNTGSTTITSGRLIAPATSFQGAIINNAELEFSQSTTGTYGGVISGTGLLVKSGSGTVTLSGANTYTSATTISNGVLNIQNAQGTGTTAGGVTVASGAALELQGGITVGAEALTINNTGISSGGSLRNISGNNTWGGAVTLGTTSRINSDAGTLALNASNAITATNIGLTVGGSGNTNISGTITTGTGTLTKDGAGTLTLSGANTYTGATTISIGVLNIQNAQGTGTTAGGVTVASGAALELQGGITVGAEALTINNTGISSGGSLRNISGNNTWGGTVTLGTTSRINSDADILTLNATNTITASNVGLTIGGSGNTNISGTITTGTGTLTKDGAGTLTLSGANTYTGLTTVSAGSLIFNRSGGTTIPATNNVTVSGGTLRVSSNQTVNNLTVSSGTLTIDANVTLTVNGTFTGGGTIQNNGTIVIKGSTFPGSTSTISAMANLEINRSEGVTLDNSLTISGVLTLTSGKLLLGNNILTITGSISGASSTNYIATSGTGTLFRNITNGSSFVFPVGNSTYNPITIANTGTTDNFWVQVTDQVLDGGTTGTAITDKIINRTWHIGKTNANTNAGVNITLQWQQNEELGTVTNHKLSHYGTRWALAAGTSGSVSTSGTTKTMTHTGYTGTFSPFSIGGQGSVLPVTWLSFTGKKVLEGVELNWSTSTEQNTKDFQVQHSINTQQWTAVGTLPAAGNSSTARDYRFVHGGSFKNSIQHYYRILQRDLDGQFSYSKVIRIDYPEGITTDLVLYPNPAQDVLHVNLGERQELRLLNMQGLVVWKGVLPAGRNEIPVSQFAPGAYTLQAGKDTYKLIIQ